MGNNKIALVLTFYCPPLYLLEGKEKKILNFHIIYLKFTYYFLVKNRGFTRIRINIVAGNANKTTISFLRFTRNVLRKTPI